jgi:hypothetical protein
MSDGMISIVPVSPDGPAMRRRQGKPPPTRRPRLDAYRLGKFARRVFNDPSLAAPRAMVVEDWRAYVRHQFRLSAAQDAALAAVDREVAAAIARTVRRLVEGGGELSATFPHEGQGGQVVFTGYGDGKTRGDRPKATALTCTFDAECRNWTAR